MAFEKTPVQHELIELMNSKGVDDVVHVLAYGGSRSGKSLAIVRQIILRAVKETSRHLLLRYRYNHARTSLGNETVPAVLRMCFAGLEVQPNKTDGVWFIPNRHGEMSEIWLGGTDDDKRMEKVLGTEYSTIFLNEVSQIPFDAIPLLISRLAETSGLSHRMFYDCNPPGKRHWTHRMFFEGRFPDDVGGAVHDYVTRRILMNPKDNLANLPPQYLKALEGLPARQRKRFLEGLYLTDVEGALWTDHMVTLALAKTPGEYRKTVIAVDPAVTNNKGSDECGIVVCSLDENRDGVVRKDLSLKCSPQKWAKRVVSAYHKFSANEVVAEVNQGGDLVEQVIRNEDPSVKVVKVRAAVGKFARAEPVSMLYEEGQNRVAHVERFPKLESELTETVFENESSSPNRLDALVWGLSHLMIQPERRILVG